MYYDEKTAAAVMNSLLNSADDSRPALKKAWIDAAGRMCACDGFRVYRLNTPVAGVPDEDAAQGIDLDRIVPSMADYKPLDLPTLADVKAMIDEDKRAAKRGEEVFYTYTFGRAENGDQLPVVNLHYLSDILKLFPAALAYYKNAVTPIVFKDENGDAMLLPVRFNGEAADMIDITKRRLPPAPRKKDTTPAFGLRTFAALYAG